MDKKVILIIGIVVVIGAGFWIWSALSAAKVQGNQLAEPTTPVTLPSGILFFYGAECPHCQNVEAFISQNDIQDKVKYTMLEVWHNADNENMLLQAAKNCGLFTKDVGVPFIYDGTKCYIGEVDVENFLKTQAGIQ